MMKKQLTAVALAALTAVSVAGCSGQTVYEYELTYNDYSGAVETYNKELFYRNDLPSLGADPGCIYIDNEADTENYGYFYVYPTSDATYGSLGICAYRTKDFAVWEEVGPVFSPDIAGGAYGTGRYWAPEVIYDEAEDMYYMFYSSNDRYNIEAEIAGDANASPAKVFLTNADKQAYSDIYYRVTSMSASDETKQVIDAAVSAMIGELENKETLTAREQTLLAELNTYAAYVAAYEAEEITASDFFTAAKLIYFHLRTIDIEYTNVMNDYAIGVAVSKSPAGPFVQYTNVEGEEGYDAQNRTIGITQPFLSSEDMTEFAGEYFAESIPEEGFTVIDPSPFVDPVTGKKYLSFVRRRSVSGTSEGQFVVAMEMGEKWTDDPKWETITRLTVNGSATVDGQTPSDTDYGVINEGPFIWYHDDTDDGKDNGLYYLTVSIDSYNSKTYSVIQAVSDRPLGPYTKLSREEGGYLLRVEDEWDNVSGTGHASIVPCGDELYIVYHAHLDTEANSGQRAIAADRVFFVKNNNGLTVMQCSGPTNSLQPLPASAGKYHNLAQDAAITVSRGANASALNDGMLAVSGYVDFVPEFEAESGETVITLTFEDWVTARAIMIYNSKDFEKHFESIDKIEFTFEKTYGGSEYSGLAVIEDLRFNTQFYLNRAQTGMNPGGAAIAEFEELRVKEVRITVNSASAFNISEICLLGY